MASLPSISTMTVLASSFPGMWVAEATSCMVNAGECWMTTYFTSW
jgi:hypothetical protein